MFDNDLTDEQADELGDTLTELAILTSVKNKIDIVPVVESIQDKLATYRLHLSPEELQQFKEEIEASELEDDEGVDVVFSLYGENDEESIYSLSAFIYNQDGAYQMDLDVVYDIDDDNFEDWYEDYDEDEYDFDDEDERED